MSFKFKHRAEDYTKHITTDILKEAFEIHGFEVELNNECKTEENNKRKMKPILLEDEWFIEVDTEHFGKVLLLDKNESLPVAIGFDTKYEALNYIKENYSEEN